MQFEKEMVRRSEHDVSLWQQDKEWCEWKAHVQSLRLSLQSKSPDSHIRQLVSECMAFYRATFTIAPSTDDLLAYISGRRSSLLEAAFMWLGGWRPSSAITLAYSKMGVGVCKLEGLANSITPTCMLSRAQLAAMEALGEQTRRAESEISDSLASVQMLIADQDMAEALAIGKPLSSLRYVGQARRLLDSKLASLRTLYMQANGLRLQTLQELQSLLTPTQAAQCAVAAFEVVYAVRKLGTTAMPSCERESTVASSE